MQPIRRLEQAVLNKTVSSGRLFECIVRVKALLDFILAQSTPPVTLWVCRRRLFAPRDSASPAAPIVGEAWKAEPYKGGCPLGYGFGYLTFLQEYKQNN